MEIGIKDNGLMIKQMDLEYIYIAKLAPDMKDIGKTTCNMAQEYRAILMGINIKACSKMEKERDKALITTLRDKFTEEPGSMAE